MNQAWRHPTPDELLSYDTSKQFVNALRSNGQPLIFLHGGRSKPSAYIDHYFEFLV
jgi:hypothetical protein